MSHAEIAQALALIGEALPLLKHGQPERALWRLVDAAGLVAEGIKRTAGEAPVSGVDDVTGRGFRLVVEATNDSEVTT
jgi:hypothetical protein